MAPKKRIYTLSDLNGGSQSFSPPEESKGPQNPYAKASSNEQDSAIMNPLAADYCQPINTKDSVPLFHIPNLLSDKVCEDTLKRIHQEFLPIIQRRKYNVKSISELCCCGDGLDHGRKGRKLRKMSNNILGYNMTRWYGRSKAHTIHLRLRNPNNHNQLLSWEDVAGTMAHELSHCVHGPHNAAFYKLMEEILEEHATLLVNRMGFNPDYRAPAGGTGGSSSNAFPTTTGHVLGGKKLGNSRLVDANNTNSGSGGHRLGGRQISDPKAMREAIARAAEARKRQMELTRRMMEKAKQPCVIEIFDSDDEEEDDEVQEVAKMPPRPARRRGQDQDGGSKKPKVDIIDLTSPDTKPNAVETKTPSAAGRCIDLTSDVEDFIEVAIPSTSSGPGTDGWICATCTLRNLPLSLVCDACLQERNL